MTELAKSPFPTSLPPGSRVLEESLVALVGERILAPGERVSGWHPESLEADVVNAAYQHGRNHYLRAAIFLEAGAIETRIVQSKGMNQEGYRIHRAALQWLGELEEQIRTALARMAALREASRAP